MVIKTAVDSSCLAYLKLSQIGDGFRAPKEVLWMNGKWNALIAAGEEWLPSYPRKRMIPAISLLHHAPNVVDRNSKSRLTRMIKELPEVR